jgi:HPr kinase/phosphorylase
VNQQHGEGDHFSFLTELIANASKNATPSLSVSELLSLSEALCVHELLPGIGFQRTLNVSRVRHLGLALCGFIEDLEPGGLFVIGRAEIEYLRQKTESEWLGHLVPVFQSGIAGLIVSSGLRPPEAFLEKAKNHEIAVFQSDLDDFVLITELTHKLEEKLAPRICFHGNLLVISGLGVLILGKSGVGKSDDALDLIAHGHQLVADDVVHILRTSDDNLWGMPDPLTRHHMNVRGLGIVNIRALFGSSSVIDHHTIDLVIYLEQLGEQNQKCEIGRVQEEIQILGLNKPLLRLPVATGRNLEILIEVAVKTYGMRVNGENAEQQLVDKLRAKIAQNSGLG